MLLLPLGYVLSDGCRRRFEQKSELGRRDASALCVGLDADPGNGFTLEVTETFTVPALSSLVLG